MMFDFNAIRELIAAAKRLDEKGFVGAKAGNISIKSGDYIYITPTGTSKAILTEEMIAIIDKDGNQVGGTLKPTSELKMHMACYNKIDREVGGVVHCHSPYLTAHALTYVPITCNAYPEMIGNFDVIEVAPYGEPGSDAIFDNALPYFERNNIVLLGNHGALSVGKTLRDAMDTMESAEDIAKVISITNSIGKPADLPEEVIAATKVQHDRSFGLI